MVWYLNYLIVLSLSHLLSLVHQTILIMNNMLLTFNETFIKSKK